MDEATQPPTPDEPARIPRGRLWPTWSVEEWRLFFNGFQALGAITIASLALYGIFFTSLPEVIVRQLRADVADAREELTGLRAERNRSQANLDAINAGLQEAREKSRQAEERIATMSDRLGKASSELAASQQQLESERSTITTMRAESEALRTSNDDARARLQQLEKDIARLTADREGYLKATQASIFLGAAFDLSLKIREYEEVVKDARAFLAAPRADAIARDYFQRMRQKGSNVQKLLEEERERMRAEFPPELVSLYSILTLSDGWIETRNFESVTRNELIKDASKLAKKTGRALIMDRFASPGSLTPNDFAIFKRSIEVAMQSKPALAQVLLVDIELVQRGGDAAMKEVGRAAAAIDGLKQFLDEYGSRLANASRR